MAKTATTKKVVKKSATKKAVKVVTPAKGKGKPALAKTKGDLKKPLKKVVAKKPAAKKVKAPKVVDSNKYGKFTIEDAFTEKYPEMVLITATPKAFEDLIGKKYVTRVRCIATLEAYIAEGTIAKGEKSILKELDANGILPLEPAETDEK